MKWIWKWRKKTHTHSLTYSQVNKYEERKNEVNEEEEKLFGAYIKWGSHHIAHCLCVKWLPTSTAYVYVECM